MKLVKKPAAKARKVDATTIKAQAMDVGGARSFPELTALLLAKRFTKVERKDDARRVLCKYLERYPQTPAILAAWLAAA